MGRGMRPGNGMAYDWMDMRTGLSASLPGRCTLQDLTRLAAPGGPIARVR